MTKKVSVSSFCKNEKGVKIAGLSSLHQATIDAVASLTTVAGIKCWWPIFRVYLYEPEILMCII